MNQQMSGFLVSSMKLGGLGNIKGGIKAGEVAIIAAGTAKKPATIRYPRILKGKAMLTIDAVIDIDGNRAYDVASSLKSCSGNASTEDVYLELANRAKPAYEVPNQCKRMAIGDRWRVSVVYTVSYTPTADHEGNEDWDVVVELTKAKTRAKSPWNDKRHNRYVSKAKRVA